MLKENLKNAMFNYAQCNAMNGISRTTEVRRVLTWYQKTLYAVMAVLAVLTLAFAVLGIVKSRKLSPNRAETKEKLSLGFYLTVGAAVLAAAAAVLYGNVMYRMPIVYVCLLVAVAVEAIAFILSNVKMKLPVYAVFPVVNGALMGAAAILAINLMINQIGYVVSGLDGIGTISSLIVYEAVVLVALLLNIVAAFLPLKKAQG